MLYGVTIEGFSLLSHLTTFYDTLNNIFIKYASYICFSANYRTQSIINALISSNNESIFNYISSVYTTKCYVDNGDQFLLGYINANFYPNIQCDGRYYKKTQYADYYFFMVNQIANIYYHLFKYLMDVIFM